MKKMLENEPLSVASATKIHNGIAHFQMPLLFQVNVGKVIW